MSTQAGGGDLASAVCRLRTSEQPSKAWFSPLFVGPTRKSQGTFLEIPRAEGMREKPGAFSMYNSASLKISERTCWVRRLFRLLRHSEVEEFEPKHSSLSQKRKGINTEAAPFGRIRKLPLPYDSSLKRPACEPRQARLSSSWLDLNF